jgi:hypothetical protein
MINRQMTQIIHSGKQTEIKTINSTYPRNWKSGPDLSSK